VPDTDKPIIAAVNGAAYGLGLAMVCWSDFKIAADTAIFGSGGLSTGVLGPWVIAVQQNLPWSAALELFLFCEEIDAQRAYEMGFLNKVAPAAEVEPLAIAYAERILSFPPRQTQLLIQIMHNARPDPPRAVWEQYWAAHREMQTLADMEAGTRAFVSRQRPAYTGA
jgi:enoyl-CoA hydratase